jgi:DNA modification methylase
LPDTEYMIHAFVRQDYDCKKRFVVGQVEKNNYDHPTVKPQYVMQKAVRSASLIGHLILDPYCGTASTGIACIRLERRFIGIEIEEKYCEIAAKRLDAEISRGNLFPERSSETEKQELLFE